MVRSEAVEPGGTDAGTTRTLRRNIIRRSRHRGYHAAPWSQESPLPPARPPDPPQLDDHPKPVEWENSRPLHVASSLAAVGALGSSLVLGLMLGLLALDTAAWARGAGFSGQSLVAAGLLGSMALLPGLGCWAAGRKLMRDRGDEPLLAPHSARIVSGGITALGALAGSFLGFPTP